MQNNIIFEKFYIEKRWYWNFYVYYQKLPFKSKRYGGDY